MTSMFLKLVRMSIDAGWLVLAVILLRQVFRRGPMWVRCLMWTLVALRLALPFSIESAMSLVPRQTVNSEQQISELFAEPEPEMKTFTDTNGTVQPIETSHTPNADTIPVTSPAPRQTETRPVSLTELVSWVWLGGVCLMALYALVSRVRLGRRVSAAVCVGGNVYVCDYIDSPFILGVFRPKIYLPSGLSEQNRQSVLAHERAHLSRRDNLWKPLGFALLAVYWFNPLMWLAFWLFCRDLELACDQRVIRDMDMTARADYSQALLDLSVRRPVVGACPLAFGETGVKARIKSVLGYKKPGFWVILAAIALCAVAAVCFLTSPKSEKTAGEEETAIPFALADVPLSDTAHDAVRENWEKWDSMDEMTQMLQSTMPGYCFELFPTWEYSVNYLGYEPWNPLEYADWLGKGDDARSWASGVVLHSAVTVIGQRDGRIDYAEISASYGMEGNTRVDFLAQLVYNEEYRPAGPERAGERYALEYGGEAVCVRDYQPTYKAAELYFVRDGVCYFVRLVNRDNDTDALNDALAKIGRALGITETVQVEDGADHPQYTVKTITYSDSYHCEAEGTRYMPELLFKVENGSLSVTNDSENELTFTLYNGETGTGFVSVGVQPGDTVDFQDLEIWFYPPDSSYLIEARGGDIKFTVSKSPTKFELGSNMERDIAASWVEWDKQHDSGKVTIPAPGWVYKYFKEWYVMEGYAGRGLDNPLENADWLEKVGSSGYGSGDHVSLTAYGELNGKATYAHADAGYRDGDVVVKLSVNFAGVGEDVPAEDQEITDGSVTSRQTYSNDLNQEIVCSGSYTYGYAEAFLNYIGETGETYYTVSVTSYTGTVELNKTLAKIGHLLGVREDIQVVETVDPAAPIG